MHIYGDVFDNNILNIANETGGSNDLNYKDIFIFCWFIYIYIGLSTDKLPQKIAFKNIIVHIISQYLLLYIWW